MGQQENAPEGLDTFEEGNYTDGPMDVVDDGEAEAEGQEAESTEEAPVQAEAKEEIDPDSQVNMLDNSEEKAEEETPKEPEGDGEKDKVESEPEPEGEEPAPENDGDTAEEVRNLKATRDGKHYEIPEDAELKVKVKGKWEKVPLTELRDNYAGKVAYDEKFQTLNEEVKTFKYERDEYETQVGKIKNDLVHVSQLIKDSYEGKASPTAGMEYLLDRMGGNPLQYKKAMFEHMADQLDVYSQMSEVEREAYWVRQENEYLTQRQESLMKSRSEEKAQVELHNNVKKLREAQNVSEEDYTEAAKNLEAGGIDEADLTPENIIRAVKLKPLLLEAGRLLEPYADQMEDEEYSSMSVEIAKTMFESPEMPIESIQKLIAEEYEVEDIVSTLVEKTQSSQPKDVSVPKKKDDHIESFDDFDIY